MFTPPIFLCRFFFFYLGLLQKVAAANKLYVYDLTRPGRARWRKNMLRAYLHTKLKPWKKKKKVPAH